MEGGKDSGKEINETSTARATNVSVKGIKDIPIKLLCNK